MRDLFIYDRGGQKINISTNFFSDSISRFNRYAEQGIDEDYRRGDTAHDRFYGDPTLQNPNLASITKSPFYAIAFYPGDIGTKGGIQTDEHARAIRKDGT